MRVVFMGTPEFAVPILATLTEHHQVLAVYTRPDAVSGRGGHTRPSPVGRYADEHGLAVRKPHTLRDPAELEALELLAPEVVVVAAYGLILPAEVLNVPLFGCVNVHASLLPRWRGAAPVQRAILAGDAVTGVSIMQMEEGLDTGPYCLVEAVEIGELDTLALTERLARLGADALISALEHIERGTCDWVEQENAEVTYADKITKDEIAVTLDMPAQAIVRHVRASSPQAPVRIRVAGKVLTLLTAKTADSPVEPGLVACVSGELLLGTHEGTVAVGRTRPEGKADMDACDWARGARLAGDARWESAR